MNNILSEQCEGSQMVKAEPALARLRKMLWVSLIIVGTFIVNLIFLLLVLPHFFTLLPGLYDFYQTIVLVYLKGFTTIVALFLLPILYFIPFRRFWKKHEQRRQAAARGDQSLLAVEQPVPDAYATSLPFTIKHRLDWSLFLTFLILGVLFGGGCFALVVANYFSPNFLDMGHAIQFGALGVLWICVSGWMLWWIYAQSRIRLIATEDGLLVFGVLPKVLHISWQEARLFAIVGVLGVKNSFGPIQFELSSADEVIRWTWLRPSNRGVQYFAKPGVSYEEHDRQMQVLLSLIAARTGLPLYDLRPQPPEKNKRKQ